MKIIKKAEMPDGTVVQIEDWSKDYPKVYPQSSCIGCYPLAKGTDGRWIKSGKTFRLALEFGSQDETEKAFSSLRSGAKTLLDFKYHFQDKKDLNLLIGREETI